MEQWTEARAKRRLREAEGYMELGLYEQALNLIASVEESGLMPFECALQHGELLRERENYIEAATCFQAARRLKPKNLQAAISLGWCLKRSDRLPDAIQVYHELLAFHPREPLVHYNLACYLSLAGQEEPSLKALGKALQLEPKLGGVAQEEEDFAPIRNHPKFQELLAASASAGEEETSDEAEK